MSPRVDDHMDPQWKDSDSCHEISFFPIDNPSSRSIIHYVYKDSLRM